jgi:hypothetical protein
VKDAKHCHDAVSLWLGRMRYVAKLIDLGYNPMYLDTDFTMQDNIYKYLKSGPARKHSLFFMREGQVLVLLRLGAVHGFTVIPGLSGPLREPAETDVHILLVHYGNWLVYPVPWFSLLKAEGRLVAGLTRYYYYY